MNKKELINAIAQKTGLTKVESEKALLAFQKIVKEEVAAGGEVQLVGFGTFKRTKRAERTGVNPQTGEKISIAETYTPKFTAGKEFKDAVKA